MNKNKIFQKNNFLITISLFLFVIFPFIVKADVGDSLYYSSGDFYTYGTPSYSSGDYYNYSYPDYSSGDYYNYSYPDYSSGDYYNYSYPDYSSGDYYNYSYPDYSSGDYYNYSYPDYSSGDYYTYDYPSYSSGDYYTYDYPSYSSGDYYNYDYSYPTYSYPDYSYDYYYDYSYPSYSYNDGYSCSNGNCRSAQTDDLVVNNTNINNNNNEVVVVDYGNNSGSNNNNNQNLSVNCEVSDTSIEEGDYVTYTANVSGGNSPYTYDWNGDVNSTGKSVRVKYNNDGTYYASITVKDNKGRTASDTCSSVKVKNTNSNNLDVQCEVSDTTVDDGDYVTVSVNVDGGNSPYDVTWSGDTGDFRSFDRNDDSQRVRVDTNSDTIKLKVKVTDDDGESKTDTCSTIRVGGNYSNNYNNYNDGELSGLSSVFLSQVPYTGPEDILKTIGFIAGLLIWSAIVATVLLRNKNRKEISSKAAAFKEANKLKKFSN